VSFQALALLDPAGLLRKARQLLLQLLHSFRPVALLNALQQFALGQGLGFRHFTQDVEVIRHQHIVHDPNPAEGRPAAHQREKFLGLRTTASGGPEDEEAMNEPGNAVVKLRPSALTRGNRITRSKDINKTIKCNKHFLRMIFDMSLSRLTVWPVP
jgi:hypothetical protein